MDPISLAIIILCFSVLIIYLKTKKYDSPPGITMIVLVAATIFLKLYFKGYASNIFNARNFLSSGLIVMGATLFICILLVLLRKNRFRPGYALTLLPLYIFFGFLQQLFFQYIFLESAYSATGLFWPSIIISALFYILFHLGHGFDTKFKISLFLLDIFWGYYYLTYHNLFWLVISHGVGATAYYVLIIKKDMIKTRLSKNITRLMPKY